MEHVYSGKPVWDSFLLHSKVVCARVALLGCGVGWSVTVIADGVGVGIADGDAN